MASGKPLEDEVLDIALGSLKDSAVLPEHLIDLLNELREAGQLGRAERLFEIFTQEEGDASKSETRKR